MVQGQSVGQIRPCTAPTQPGSSLGGPTLPPPGSHVPESGPRSVGSPVGLEDMAPGTNSGLWTKG